ncbi:hypothetical protein SMD11_1172 [Streptomyces albireticuli]|uniref:Uncharacterized protein n=1 Tax=Streptomyces albireticuli TaxID=1940 RepID=A0A1Z2KXQ6_9ACTN|nr:hypothetical protein SMD11_1172 [Streptomyces albireticuli]
MTLSRASTCGCFELDRYVERPSGVGVIVPVRHYCPMKIGDDTGPEAR